MSTRPPNGAEAERLITSLTDRSACIGIVGMGYVGLPLAVTYANAGYRVLGFDIDARKVERLNCGTHIASRVGSIITNHAVDSLDSHLPGQPVVIEDRCWIGMNHE